MFRRGRDGFGLVRMGVPVRVAARTMRVVVEEEEPDDVGREAKSADDDDQTRIGDLGGVEEPFDGFHEDGEAERCKTGVQSRSSAIIRGRRTEEEDAVDESPEHLGPLPSVRKVL